MMKMGIDDVIIGDSRTMDRGWAELFILASGDFAHGSGTKSDLFWSNAVERRDVPKRTQKGREL